MTLRFSFLSDILQFPYSEKTVLNPEQIPQYYL